jgi:hypothetical protein
MNEYEQQAEQFLKETGTEFKSEFLENSLYFPDDKEKRDIYLITLKRGSREYKFKFGQSLNNSGKYIIWTAKGKILINEEKEAVKYRLQHEYVKRNKEFSEPTAYDVLTSLTKYNPDGFSDFCSSYGYDEDSIKAEKTYQAVLKEWGEIQKLYSDEEINKLQEIN